MKISPHKSRTRFVLAAVALALAASGAHAQTYSTWQGSSTSWNNGANWSSGNVTNYGQLQWTGGGNATSDDDLTFDLSQWRMYFSGSTAYTLTASGGHVVNLFDLNNAFPWILSDSTANQTINVTVNFATGSNTANTFGQISARSTGNLIFNNIGITGSQVSQLRIAGQSTGKVTVNGGISGTSKDVLVGLDETSGDRTSTDVTFNGANTYTGTTYVVAGTLHLGSGSSLTTSSIQLGQNSGGSSSATLDLAATGGGQVFSTPITVRAGSSGTKTISSAADGTGSANTLSGPVTVNDNFTVTSATGGNLVFSGTVSNASTAKTMFLNGGGTVTLQGTGDNAFLQGNVSSGTLVLNKTSDSTHHALGGATETVSGGILQLSGSGGDQIVDTAGVTITSGTFDLNGKPETVAGLSLQGGSVSDSAGTSGVLTSNSTYDLRSGAVSGKLGGTVGATKSTNGTVTLSGANSYTGSTSITGGSLALSGSGSVASSSQVSVSSGATFDISGVTSSTSVKILSETGSGNGGAAKLGSKALTMNGGGATTYFFNNLGVLGDTGSFTLNAANSSTVLSLYGTSLYTGSTTLSAGTLTTSSSMASSSYSLGGGNLTTTSGANLSDTASVAITSGTFTVGAADTIGAISGSGGAILLNANLTSTVNGTSNYSGALTGGAGILIKAGTGSLTLDGIVDNPAARAEVSNGTLVLAKASGTSVHALGATDATALSVDSGASAQLGGSGGDQIFNRSGVVISSGGAFDMNGQNETIQTLSVSGGGISSGGALNNSAASASTLIVQTGGGTSSTNFVGNTTSNVATNGSLELQFNSTTTGNGNTLTKTGGGTLSLTGSADNSGLRAQVDNGTLILAKGSVAGTGVGGVHAIGSSNVTGLTVNNGGTVQLGGSGGDQIYDFTGVVMNGGGRFNTAGLTEGMRPTTGGSTNGAAGIGALTLQSASSGSPVTFDFGAGANGSSLVFSSLGGGASAYVNILNWDGTARTDNGATTNDRLLFASDPGLSAAQLANFNFSGYAPGAMEIAYGNLFEIVPVPEPGTWAMGALALASLLVMSRKRLRSASFLPSTFYFLLSSRAKNDRRVISEARS